MWYIREYSLGQLSHGHAARGDTGHSGSLPNHKGSGQCEQSQCTKLTVIHLIVSYRHRA